MPAAQTVTLFLMDGTPTGRIKCTLSNWIGQVYVLPRTGLAGSTRREELTRSGVYLLTGEDPATGEPTVYVGQAARRANGRGVLGRIIEHKADPAKDYFTRAIAVVAADDSLGQTEITYLENALHGLLKEAGRARVDNDVVPAPGTVTEEKRAELDQFLEFMRLAIGSLGYPLTEPADPRGRPAASTSEDDGGRPGAGEPELHLEAAGAAGRGRRTPEGFVVYRGAQLRGEVRPSAPASVARSRELLAERIDAGGVLTRDTLFGSPSAASSFLTGSSTNGLTLWRDGSGVSLKDLEG